MQVLQFKHMGSLIDFKQNYFNRLIKFKAWQSRQIIQSDYEHSMLILPFLLSKTQRLSCLQPNSMDVVCSREKFKGKITMLYTHEQRPTTVRIVQVDTNPLAQMGIKCCTGFVPTYCTRVKVNVCMEDRVFLPVVSVLSEKAINFTVVAFLLFYWTRKVLLHKQG